jgi:hypothetical protein
MTSWRKFKKKFKKEAAKRTYGHYVTFTDAKGNEFYGILKGFYPRLETSQNGRRLVVWIANIEPTHKIMQDKEWVDDGGSASFNFTAPTKDVKIEELLGL